MATASIPVSIQARVVAVLGNCRIADSHAEFLFQVEDALKTPGPQAAISESVREHSWESRLNEIASYLSSN